MDFETHDTPEMAAFRKEVKAFLKAVVSKDLAISPHESDRTQEQYQKRREIGKKLGERGWLYPTMPKQYGGGGLTLEHAIVLEQEMDEYGITLHPYYDAGHLAAPDILVWGTEEQKRAFLSPMLRGEVLTWQLLTEPHGGSDLASTKTTAVRDGDEYVVNGAKTFIGDDHQPDLMWTIVLTDPNGPRHQNLSWLIIPGDRPGITIQPLDLLASGGPGEDGPAGHKNSIFLEDVRVPAFNLVGGENNGWKVANTHLELEHGGAGTVRKDRFLERFIKYCKPTKLGINNDPDVRDLVADLVIESDVSRLFGLRNFWMRWSRKQFSYEGSQSSYFRKMSGLRVAHGVQKAVGYMAITGDNQWAAASGWADFYLRSAISAVHPGGTQDVQRVIMARRMGVGRTVKEEPGRIE